MNKRTTIGLVFAALLIVLVSAEGVQARPAGGGQVVRVTLTATERMDGALIQVALITEEHMSRPGTGFAVVSEPWNGESASVEIGAVPDGSYAIRAFVDTNGNGRLDRGPLGPTEPWALSWRDGQRHRFPPRFESISFEVSRDTSIALTLE